MTDVARGFPKAEYEDRLERAHAAMTRDDLDALVVTTPQNVRYFTGFASTFWESPTRPWFVIVPRGGMPWAVIPDIGADGFRAAFVDDIATWPAPQPDDDGISLLQAQLEALPRTSGRIGFELGREMSLRMPVLDFDQLRSDVRGLSFVDASPLIWELRLEKSEREIAAIRRACEIAGDAFEALEPTLAVGQSEHEIARTFRQMLHACGADQVPFLSVCSGAGSYRQIIVGPSERTLETGDVLFIDVGATWEGYFCDFDRNFAFGTPSAAVMRAQETLWQATEAGIAAARPGATTADLFAAMAERIEADGFDSPSTGRLGHGLGLQLTEPPSHMPDHPVVLRPNMVLTIEPGLEIAPGRMLVHEENIVVRDGGAELLTRRAPREMPVVGAG
ncbi:MAG: Xaa-Pro peptidase family protein [Pseudomonadota bacterium]